MKDTQLPIFVYGTLRPGGTFYPRVREFVQSHKPAELDGFVMYEFGQFPGITHGEGIVQGDALYVFPDKWEECLAVLDRIESNGYLFKRTDNYIAFTAEEIFLPVWVYLVNDKVLEPVHEKRVWSNDWLRRW